MNAPRPGSGQADTGISTPALDALRRLTSMRRPMTERCEFCGHDLPDEHGHLVNVPARALLCVCRPCYLLFMHDGAGGRRFRAVPDRYRRCESLDAATWRAFGIPVGIAFLFSHSVLQRTVVQYPSPAGATEAELADEVWAEAVKNVPSLATLEPDVEALLVRRHDEGTIDTYVVPIDACYELAGRLRGSWRGFQGGDDAWREVDDFFARVRTRAGEGTGSGQAERVEP